MFTYKLTKNKNMKTNKKTNSLAKVGGSIKKQPKWLKGFLAAVLVLILATAGFTAYSKVKERQINTRAFNNNYTVVKFNENVPATVAVCKYGGTSGLYSIRSWTIRYSPNVYGIRIIPSHNSNEVLLDEWSTSWWFGVANSSQRSIASGKSVRFEVLIDSKTLKEVKASKIISSKYFSSSEIKDC